MVIALNQQYQDEIDDALKRLKVLLNANLEKQKNLSNGDDARSNAKKINLSYFGAPYFKCPAENGGYAFECPPKNIDVAIMEDMNVPNVALKCCYRPFTRFERDKLKNMVREQALALVTMQDINLQDHELPINRNMAIDWNHVSSELFRNDRKPIELELYWQNALCPEWEMEWKKMSCPNKDNRRWQVRDNQQLKEAVRAYDTDPDWDEIASKMGAGHTAFGCFARYQSRYNSDTRKKQWTEEENLELARKLSKYSDWGHIDWVDLMKSLPGRTKTQIYSHCVRHPELFYGPPFQRVEDAVVVEGVGAQLGFDHIAQLLANRTTLQVNWRYDDIVKKEQLKAMRKSVVATRIRAVFRKHAGANNMDSLMAAMSDAIRKETELAQRAKIGRPKNATLNAEAELKAIVRPLIWTARKRPRNNSMPGDGREHGLIQASLHRALGCNLDKFPPTGAANDQLEELGIEKPDVDSFRVLRSIVDEMPKRTEPQDEDVDSDEDPEQVSSSQVEEDGAVPEGCLPPTLITLTGMRGLLLHRNHLRIAAAMDAPSNSEGDPEDVYEGDPQADAALLERIMTLFYWPAVMSTVKETPHDQQPAEVKDEPSVQQAAKRGCKTNKRRVQVPASGSEFCAEQAPTLKRKPGRPASKSQPAAKRQKCEPEVSRRSARMAAKCQS